MKKYNVTVNGVLYEVEVEEAGEVSAPVQTTPVSAPAAAPKAARAASQARFWAKAPKAAAAGSTVIKAPMQGTIVKVNAKSGDAVKKGDVLVVLEAMKMENDIKAPADGTVASVAVSQGDTVATDDVLVSMN